MKTYRYYKLNAFVQGNSKETRPPFSTSAAILSPTRACSASQRSTLGFVSEVVYARKNEEREILLTYYSSECEVAFCGHGTIATMYEIIGGTRH